MTIELVRTGSTLTRTYHLPGRTPSIFHNISGPWHEIGDGYSFDGLRGIEALQRVLERGKASEIEQHLGRGSLDQVGELLFGVLFGADVGGGWSLVARELMGGQGGEQGSPWSHAVRVRIVTTDETLMGLPWRVTMWNKRPLCDHGWTFEITPSLLSKRHVTFRQPGRMLVVAPEVTLLNDEGDRIRTALHIVEIEQLFQKLVPGFTRSGCFAVVRTWEELREAVRRMSPEIVYFYGHGVLHEKQLNLLLSKSGLPDFVVLSSIATLLRAASPVAVFINACWSGQAGWHSAGAQLADHVPLVISNCTAAFANEARRYALDWMREWLGGGVDPVVAAHARELRAVSLRSWGTAIVHADYAAITTLPSVVRGPRHPDGTEERYDRDRPRAVVYKHVSELTKDDVRRVEVVLVYGEPRNALDKIAKQMVEYIEEEAGRRIHARRETVTLPPAIGGSLTHNRIREKFLGQFRRLASDDLGHVLHDLAPKVMGDAKRVLWLDFGVVRPENVAALNLGAYPWLKWIRDEVARACPADIRIVASLGIEASEPLLGQLKQKLPEIRRKSDFRTREMRCTVIDPLVRADKDDILNDVTDFAEKHGCDPNILEELVTRIYDATDGHYEDILALFRKGLMTTWHQLLDELRTRGD